MVLLLRFDALAALLARDDVLVHEVASLLKLQLGIIVAEGAFIDEHGIVTRAEEGVRCEVESALV